VTSNGDGIPESQEDDSLLKRLGPGLITGASDDDPSGIGTYSQAGAQLGFGIGWTMLLTYPLMVAIQEISGRIGRITGHGVAGNVRQTFVAIPFEVTSDHQIQDFAPLFLVKRGCLPDNEKDRNFRIGERKNLPHSPRRLAGN
jgi:hypothetical protein